MIKTKLPDSWAQASFIHCPCGIAIIDVDFRLVRTNATFDRLFAHSDATTCYQVLKGATEPCVPCIAMQVWQDGRQHSSQLEGLTPDQKAIRCAVTASPCFDEKSQITHVMLFSNDVSRQAELEDGLKEAERLARVGLSAAGLAHTIKNILAGLDGGIYMVDSALTKGDPKRLRSGWQMVQGYIDRVSLLVRNLLQLAKPRAPKKEWVDLVALVHNVMQLFTDKAAMADITLEADIDPRLECQPGIQKEGASRRQRWLDADAIHAAVTNLMTNACDACTWDPDGDKQHRISLGVSASDNGGIQLEIRDTGMGIAVDDQPKILNKLFTSKGMRGTGLGLLLTKKAIDEDGGHVTFESEPGVGTTFRIEFPGPGEQPPPTDQP